MEEESMKWEKELRNEGSKDMKAKTAVGNNEKIMKWKIKYEKKDESMK